MYDEKRHRLLILNELYDTYQKFTGSPVMQNNVLREMVPHCNRLFISVGEYLLSKVAHQVAAPAVTSSSKASFPFKCPHCEKSFKSQKAVDGHQKNHRNSKILSVKTA